MQLVFDVTVFICSLNECLNRHNAITVILSVNNADNAGIQLIAEW